MKSARLTSYLVWIPLVISLGATIVLPLASFILVGTVPGVHSSSPLLFLIGESDTLVVLMRTACFAVFCTIVQFAIGLRIGIVAGRVLQQSALIALLAMPLLAGPATCAVLWKAILDPFNGAPAILASWIGLRSLDWTANSGSTVAVVAFVQIWIWSFAAGAAIATLFDTSTTQARNIFLLDGGRQHLADLWSLWITRQRWIVLIGLALFVENLRAFEVIFVLTRGGPGSATETIQWKIFEASYVLIDAGKSAAWVILLLVVFQIGLVPFGAWVRRNARNA